MRARIYPAEKGLLVTLCCPECGKRVAVMDHYPILGQPIEKKEITLIDGRTPDDPETLVCPRCFSTFPPRKSKVPSYLIAKGMREGSPKEDRTDGENAVATD